MDQQDTDPIPAEKEADTGSLANEPKPKRGLRAKIGFGLLLGGLAFLLVAFFSQPRLEGEANPLRMVAATLAGAGILLGLGVLVFGTIKVASVLSIDLRGGRTVFHVGFPFLSVKISDQPEHGAFSLSRTRSVYLVVPWTVRLALVCVIAYSVYGLAAPHLGVGLSLVLAVVTGLVLWVLQRRLGRGSRS